MTIPHVTEVVVVPYQHALATYYTLLILYDEVLYMPVDEV